MKKVRLKLIALLGVFCLMVPTTLAYAEDDVEFDESVDDNYDDSSSDYGYDDDYSDSKDSNVGIDDSKDDANTGNTDTDDDFNTEPSKPGATESDDVHDALPVKKVQPSGYTSNFKPVVQFFKCIDNTSSSLTFALGTYYIRDTRAKSGKIVHNYTKPDGIHYICKDVKTGDIIEGDWSTSSLHEVKLPLNTKIVYNNKGKATYEIGTFLANGITSSGTTSGGYKISGLEAGHKYSVSITVWNKGSHCTYHYETYQDSKGKTQEKRTACTYYDNYETSMFKAQSTATAATSPANGDVDAEVVSTRLTGTTPKYQTIYMAWNRNAGIDKYTYVVSKLGEDGKFTEYKENFRGNENPKLSGMSSGGYIKVPSNTISKVTVYATGSVYGLRKVTKTIGAEKTKASQYNWFLAPSTNKNSAKAVEVIPQVQVTNALNKGGKIKVNWQKIRGLKSSDNYIIYCSVANSVNTFKKVGKVSCSTSTYTFNKVSGKAIDSKKNYSVYVVAVDNSVDLPEDDVDIDVTQNKAQSLVNYSFRATRNGKTMLIGKR